MVSASQRLYEARKAKGLTLEEVAKATKIRQAFLSAIESGEYDRLPTGTYTQGFVSNYAEYLGLPKREITALFRREYNVEKDFKVLPESLSKQKEVPVHKGKLKQTIGIILLLFLGLLGYLGFQYRHAFLNPPLDVSSPKQNAVLTSQTITIQGTSDPSNTVLVNNEPVSLDTNGAFKKSIDVFPGKTTITIKAVNTFGKETLIKRDIDVRP